MSELETKLSHFKTWLEKRNNGQTEFLQAVNEVAESLMPFIMENPEYGRAKILERMTEPDRIISFRVCWNDDKRKVRINRGYRVQFNNSIGPYKGGLRFHPSVNTNILKFLGFEQTFKNSLTTLPMGGGKGGANFDPKGKSDEEVMRFCQSFMTELARYLGKDEDVVAGDIGVGAREIGYLFGHYKRMKHEFSSMTTGKGLSYGGSAIRTEATGYGCVYMVQEMLSLQGRGLKGKTCLVSGSGNVAQHVVEKCIHLGAKPITLSDSSGFIYDPNGISAEKLAYVKELKNIQRGRIEEYATKYKCAYYPGEKPWGIKADYAFPSATQNEIDLKDAKNLIGNGIQAVAEGANMPTTLEALKEFKNAKILFCPGKAANAGGVAVSGLEQAQNAMRLYWSREEVDEKLKEIIKKIHSQCVEYGKEKDSIDYVKGANIAGFLKVADAMLAFGAV